MSDQAYAPRYNTLSPELVAERGLDAAKAGAAAEPTEDRFDRFHRALTWAILSICLAVWAVIGFVFWVPLMLRSMLRFTFALSGSMLSGQKPVEAGRILRDTVSFYRRGFTIAIGAVVGGMPEEKTGGGAKKSAKLSRRDMTFQVLWSAVFWYILILASGAEVPSPVEGWTALVEHPWETELHGLIDRVLYLIGR